MKQNEKISRLAGFGMVASSVGIAVLCMLFGAMALYLFGLIEGFDLVTELGLSDIVATLDFKGRAVALFFWLMTDALGLWFCCIAFALFRGFRDSGVFTLEASLRLRRIGWIIFALSPVRILSRALGSGAVSCLYNCGDAIKDNVRISVSIDDTDIYAVVIGLLIVAVGHIFIEAVRLSEENEAFV